jgi:aminopeptidase N
MRERLARDPALARRPERDWGWIDLTSLRVIPRGGTPADMIARARFIAPDDGNADDRTVLEVPLDRPVAPGETVNVQIAWSSRVPRTFARTGVVGDFYFVAQWFPKIGVLEDTGWNTHQFHSATEFFADFGSYDVRLTVPRGWIVGATGAERDRRDEPDGTTTHHYAADDVHDFAWTTSPNMIERRATFEHAGLQSVDMRLFLQPEHAGQADRHFAAARAALKSYGTWYGPYPYTQLTIVDPAYQSEADGMEYPTLITAGTRWLAPRDVVEPEEVVIHEIGHQFWYGIVATNEFEHAWMDEGLNTYSTARVIEQSFQPNYFAKRYFGDFIPWVFKGFPLSRTGEGDRMSTYRPAATTDTPATPTWRYWPTTAGYITYGKTALWLHTLEQMVGAPTFQRILSTYFSRWSFRHPGPADFFAIVNEISGRDFTWFFDQVYRGSGVFDYSVQMLRSEPNADRGYFGEGPQRAFRGSRQGQGEFATTVVVRRNGEGVFPVDVRLVLENKEEVRWQWDGRDRWKSFEVVKPSRASFVQVDPNHVLLLDVNYTNNSASTAPRSEAAARKWSLLWLVWLQDHLLTYGFFV